MFIVVFRLLPLLCELPTHLFSLNNEKINKYSLHLGQRPISILLSEFGVIHV